MRRGETGVPAEKSLSEQGENQQQSQPAYDTGAGNRTRATLVGGECSHNYTTPVSFNFTSSPRDSIQHNERQLESPDALLSKYSRYYYIYYIYSFCFVLYLLLYQVYDIYVYLCICCASFLTFTFLIIITTVT